MSQHSDLLSSAIPSSKHYVQGKFGRIFPSLPPCQRGSETDISDLEKIAQFTICLSDPNNTIPAGYTYLGQFIGHDMSFDLTSINERNIDPECLWNFRTPALDLDSIYGGGPSIMPYLYDQDPSKGYGRTYFLLEVEELSDGTPFDDVPRMGTSIPSLGAGASPTFPKTAIIADSRNDDNIIISRIHSAFLSFHNKMIDKVKEDIQKFNLQWSPDDIFRETQKLVRWHYQWIVLYDYLPRIIDLSEHQDIPHKLTDTYNFYEKIYVAREQVKWFVEDKNRRKYYTWKSEPYIPLEFSIAAFRFGHSQVRSNYMFNPNLATPKNLFPIEYSLSKRHFARVNLRSFFPDKGERGIASNSIDPFISDVMAELPVGIPKVNLPLQNLLRGLQRNIPSGQSIAKAMGLAPIFIDEPPSTCGNGTDSKFPEHLKYNTPLWYYILCEAFKKNKGFRLGPVCSRIVAEVIIGIIQGDKTSFLNQDPNWTPTDENGEPKPDFSMVDLLKFAGVYEPSDPS